MDIKVIDAADVTTTITHGTIPVTEDTGVVPAFSNIVNLPTLEVSTVDIPKVWPGSAAAEAAPVKKAKVLLADTFTELLRNAGHANPEAWKETNFGSIHPDHVYCDEPLQRFHVNRQLRLVMGKATEVLGVDTINLRGMLMDERDVTVREWTAPVKNSIVPFFVKHSLPTDYPEAE